MRNKFAGNCLVCGERVQPGAGYFQRINGGWACRCVKCVGKGNDRAHPIASTSKENEG